MTIDCDNRQKQKFKIIRVCWQIMLLMNDIIVAGENPFILTRNEESHF